MPGCVYVLEEHHGCNLDHHFIQPIFQSLSFHDKEHACVTSTEVTILTAGFCYNCSINRFIDSLNWFLSKVSPVQVVVL